MQISRFNPLQFKATIVYMLMIPFVNWAFENTAHLNVALPENGVWNPFTIVVGLVLVVRDFAQREIGQFIFIPLLIAVFLSYVLAPPAIATASAVAFFVSEMVDWAVYTYTKAPLSARVLISSGAGIPVDTIIFLYGANMAIPGFFNIWTFGTMIVSKLAGAIIVYYIIKAREKRLGAELSSTLGSDGFYSKDR